MIAKVPIIDKSLAPRCRNVKQESYTFQAKKLWQPGKYVCFLFRRVIIPEDEMLRARMVSIINKNNGI